MVPMGRYKYCVVFILLCLPVLSSGQSEYISKFGQELLAKSNLIVEGIPVAVVSLQGGGTLVHFQVTGIYHGQIDILQKIFLFYPREADLLTGDKTVAFLRLITPPANFSVVGNFSLKENDATPKLKALTTLLPLELIPTHAQKQQSYRAYCLAGMQSDNLWLQQHAMGELTHLLATQKSLVDNELRKTLQKIHSQAADPLLRRQIQQQLVLMRQHFPTLAEDDKASPLKSVADVLQQLREARQQLQTGESLPQKLQALQILSHFPCQESLEGLIAALHDTSPQIRALAVFYLGHHQYREAIPVLRQILQKDGSFRVRKNAIVALAHLQAVDAIPDIEKYVKLPYTQWTAKQALQKLSRHMND